MGELLRLGDWIFRIRERFTTVSPDRETVYSFDLEGRPLSWYQNGRLYKRSLGGELHGRERIGGARRYWHVPRERTLALYRQLLDTLAVAPRASTDDELERRLDRILRWSPQRLLSERARFDAAYRPIGILPPDQYLAVVLQATLGCTWNRCTFCSFYQDRDFSVRTVDSFRSHAERVRELLGRGAALRRRIFLGDGNALVLANRRLRPIFDAALQVFPGRGLYGFVDVFAGQRKGVDAWSELRRAGLRRVYVGVETGNDRLLRWLNKPGDAAGALAFVEALKLAGLEVSVILMVGVGGRRSAGEHVRSSLDLAARLPLGRGDVVYLSPFRPDAASEYARRAAAEGVEPLDDGEGQRQYATLRDGIREVCPDVRVSRYDIREFVY